MTWRVWFGVALLCYTHHLILVDVSYAPTQESMSASFESELPYGKLCLARRATERVFGCVLTGLLGSERGYL